MFLKQPCTSSCQTVWPFPVNAVQGKCSTTSFLPGADINLYSIRRPSAYSMLIQTQCDLVYLLLIFFLNYLHIQSLKKKKFSWITGKIIFTLAYWHFVGFDPSETYSYNDFVCIKTQNAQHSTLLFKYEIILHEFVLFSSCKYCK